MAFITLLPIKFITLAIAYKSVAVGIFGPVCPLRFHPHSSGATVNEPPFSVSHHFMSVLVCVSSCLEATSPQLHAISHTSSQKLSAGHCQKSAQGSIFNESFREAFELSYFWK